MTILTPDNVAYILPGTKIKVYSPDDIPLGFCGALYGAGGVGKTTLAGSIVNSELGRPALVIDAEGGAIVLRGTPNIDIASVEKWSDIEDIRRSAEKGDLKNAQGIPYRSFILDNTTWMQQLHLSSIFPANMTGETDPRRFYNMNTATMLAHVKAWRDITRFGGKNVVFIAWETTTEKGGKQKTGVKFTPSFQEQFPGMITFVGRVYAEKKLASRLTGETQWGRVLDLSPDPGLDAKFRRPLNGPASQIPLVIPNPDLGDFIDTIIGGKPWPTKKYEFDQQTLLAKAESNARSEAASA